VPAGLGSRACCQWDIESPWLRHWCDRLGLAPLYHRKVWEDAWVVQMLWEAGMLTPGRRGLGFAVGQEQLPALLAARGLDITATDLASQGRGDESGGRLRSACRSRRTAMSTRYQGDDLTVEPARVACAGAADYGCSP
jgi:hypothetical protein